MITNNAVPSEEALTNNDLNDLAVRLIAITSRFHFGADGSYRQLLQDNEKRPFADDLDELSDDLGLAAKRIQTLARLMRTQIGRRAKRDFSPQEARTVSAKR